MGEMVSYDTDAGTTEAYLAVPPGGSGPGLVVIQEWWGLVDHIKDVCDRFADEGFVALAPDLYDGEIADDDDEAGRRMQELKVADAAVELTTGIGYLLAREDVVGERVGVVGYCMGGALAIVTADKAAGKVGACDAYYGVFWYGDPELSSISCPVVLRVGTEDDYISVDKVGSLADHIRVAGAEDVRMETYEGAGHAFFNDTRDNHDEGAAQRAWQDTVALFRENLGG